MITGMAVKNFKAFSSLPRLLISPITVLSGTNSSGKSSILHSLLLLKQSLSQELPEEALILDGQYLQYTHLKEISFGVPHPESASIEDEFELKEADGFSGTLSFEIRHKPLPQAKEKKGPAINSFSWWPGKNGKEMTINLRKGRYRCPKRLMADFPPLPKRYKTSEKPLLLEFRHFLPENFLVPAQLKEKEPDLYLTLPLVGYVQSPLTRLIEMLKQDLSRIEYLGPSRAIPRRAYVHYSAQRYELDEDGGNAAYVFYLRRNEKVQWRNKQVPLEHAVHDCLSVMGLHQHVTPKRAGHIVYQLLVDTSSEPTRKVTLADVGFGYSQVLPIILRGLLAKKNALLLFEQPEIHLHPSSKAKLAELFLAFIESGNRVIVETHSTELINNLQLKVIEDPAIAEKINMVFIEPPDPEGKEGSRITQLNLKEDGMFDAWPDGFCDESEKLARALLEARVKKSAGRV